ncbi:MAG: substrate-binding domain-containing protein [Egibacteraceae bacterium]
MGSAGWVADPVDRDPGESSSGTRGRAVNVALVIPLQGPAGMFGPSCALCARLAAEEVNDEGGLLGRELRLILVDGGDTPDRVARRVELLVRSGRVEAVTGWHISAVRQAITPRLHGRVPYVYTPLYEGGERTPGVFLAGETPGRQLGPAMRWLERELGVGRWCIVGDDYIWPRGSAAAARCYAREHRTEIRDEVYVGLGSEAFSDVVARVARSHSDGVLMLLVGEDAVHFCRAFADAGLDSSILRFSPLMEENMMLAAGANATRNLYSAAGFFESLANPGSLDFVGRYSKRFGPCAPVLNSLGESCYEGVRLLAALVRRAGSLEVPDLMRVADGVGYEGPRGRVYLRNRHLVQDVYIARADALEFDVLARL